MKRVFIVEDFMKHIADELRKKDDERRLSSEDYVSGYNDALEFVFFIPAQTFLIELHIFVCYSCCNGLRKPPKRTPIDRIYLCRQDWCSGRLT